jgi:hypothetical protein
MSNVVRFPGVTTLDLPVETVFDMAKEAEPTEVVVLGYDKDGQFFAISSRADGPNVLWLLEQCKLELFSAAVDIS